MAGVRSQLNDFEIEEFFRSLQTLLSSSFNNNISYDSAEYLSRRLDVYERNINILLTRLRESKFITPRGGGGGLMKMS